MNGGLVSTKIVAELLNLSERRIEQLAQKRIIPKAGKGKYDPVPVVQAYIRYLQQKLVGGGETIDVSELKDRKLKAETEEREAKAERARIVVEIEKGELVKRKDVIREWIGRLVEVKAAMLELPQRVSFLFSDPDVKNTIEEEVTKTIYEVLEVYSRNGLHTRPVDVGGACGPKTAGANKRKRVGGQKQSTDEAIQ